MWSHAVYGQRDDTAKAIISALNCLKLQEQYFLRFCTDRYSRGSSQHTRALAAIGNQVSRIFVTCQSNRPTVRPTDEAGDRLPGQASVIQSRLRKNVYKFRY